MRFVKKSPSAIQLLVLGVLLFAVALITLTGCGVSGSTAGFLGPHALLGSVRGGNQPVSGSSIQLYAAGNNGVGSAAQALLITPAESDNYGRFFIPASFRCPSPSSQIYVVARGGNPGLSPGTDNSALALEAMLGTCSSLSAGSPILVDEVTTVGSVWPLAHYMKSAVDLGSAQNDSAFLSAIESVPEFVNLAQGSSPGIATTTSYFAQSSKLYSLADVLANCVNSAGGSAGDSSACGLLFSMTTPAGGAAPTDTITAAMEIAQHPENHVTDLFGLVKADTPFKPSLSTAPQDWTLPLTYAIATDDPTPVRLAFVQQPSDAAAEATISPAVGVAVEDARGNLALSATEPVTLALVDGSGLAGTLTVTPQNGIATFSDLSVGAAGSGLTLVATSPLMSFADSAPFTISAPGNVPDSSPVKLEFTQQPTNALTQATIKPAVQVRLEDARGKTVTSAANPVTLALAGGTGLGGTLSVTPQNGIATFSNLTVSAAGHYTLLATSPRMNPVSSTTFTISAPGSGSIPTPVKLAFLRQPSNALTQAIIAPAVQVAVEDGSGDVVTSAANAITLSLNGGTTLGGTLTVTPQNGVATFSNLTISTAGAGYTLSAASPNLTSAKSTNFTINAPSSSTNGTTVLPSTPPSIMATPGGTFVLTYNWQAVPVTGPYSVFVDFIDSAGTTQFEDNVPPPTSPSVWTGAVEYSHTVTVPSSAAMGTYRIVVGLHSTSGNLSLVAGAGVTSLGNGEYQTGTLTLTPTCSITSFGAVGDGVTDNATAIQNTFNHAATNHCIALVPAGTFAYSGNIIATGIAVAGTGSASILAPLFPTNSALELTGSGGSVSNLVMVSKATARLTTPWSGMIWVNAAQNYYVENVLINNSPSTGIMSYNSHAGYVMNNTVENTLADSITQADGAYNIVISANRILNSSDDGISNNSYVGEPLIHDIAVQGNTVLHNLLGRGVEVSGGSNITFTGNYVDNPDGFADVYVASENQWSTQGSANVTVSGNTLVDGGPNQGSVIVYNSQGSLYNITNVTVSGNQFVKPGFVAVQFTGNGSATGIVLENNTDYSTGAFSETANPLAIFTETGNQIEAPSAYTAALSPAGGGCNFSGC